MPPFRQNIIYIALLIPIFFLEDSGIAKAILSLLIITVVYFRHQRMNQLKGQILEKSKSNALTAIFLIFTLLLHSIDSDVRVLAELTFIITLTSWFLQSIRLNQRLMVTALFISLIFAMMMLVIHVELDKLGVEIKLVKVNTWYITPLLILKIMIELRKLIYQFKLVTQSVERKAYDPNENNWFASTFGIVSHNLKTPLAAIQGQIDIIRLKLDLTETNSIVSHLQHIEHSIDATKAQLEQTIKTFKNRIEILKYPEPSMIVLMALLKEEYPDSITCYNHPPPLPLSPNEIFSINLALQVIQDNALKYGKKPIIWEFNDYNVSIRDHGPGFPEKIILTQGNAMQQSSNTGGVGLFYAKSILKTVGWTLTLSNDEGACVEIEKGPINDYQMAKIW